MGDALGVSAASLSNSVHSNERASCHCRANMGAPRYIPQQRSAGFKVHRSVKLRMEAEYEDEKRRANGKRYIPKPVFKVEPIWVD